MHRSRLRTLRYLQAMSVQERCSTFVSEYQRTLAAYLSPQRSPSFTPRDWRRRMSSTTRSLRKCTSNMATLSAPVRRRTSQRRIQHVDGGRPAGAQCPEKGCCTGPLRAQFGNAKIYMVRPDGKRPEEVFDSYDARSRPTPCS